MSVRIVPVAALDAAQRRAAAPLAQAALEEYYAPLPAAIAADVIAESFLVEGDEVAGASAALDEGGHPVGLVAGYPVEEMVRRQQAALYHIMSTLPRDVVGDFLAGARALAAAVPRAEDGGYHLARIGVAAAARGSGLADRLLTHFLAEAGTRDAVLHVRGDNARAIAFYRKHGFVVTHDEQRYWLMRRPVG